MAFGRKAEMTVALDARTPATREKLLQRLTVLFLLLSLVMSAASAPLVTDAAPLGLVTLEFAGSAAVAGRVIASWSEALQHRALVALSLDYLYLLVYPALLSLACLRTAERFEQEPAAYDGSTSAMFGRCLAFFVLAAAPLDGIENFALIRALVDGPSDAWAGIAWWCAVGKFLLIVAAVLYVSSALMVQWRDLRVEGRENT